MATNDRPTDYDRFVTEVLALMVQTGYKAPSDDLLRTAFDNGLTPDELRHRVRIMQNVELEDLFR